MARTGKGILDGFRGSIGQTTGSRDKGKSVIRAKPRNTPKTQTPALIISKNKLANVTHFYKGIHHNFAKQYWNSLSTKRSAFNSFVSENFHCFTQSIPTPPENFILTEGIIPKETINNVTFNDAGPNVSISFSVDWGLPEARLMDIACVLVYNLSRDEFCYEHWGETWLRQEEVMAVSKHKRWGQNDEIITFLSFKASDSSNFSNTNYHLRGF